MIIMNHVVDSIPSVESHLCSLENLQLQMRKKCEMPITELIFVYTERTAPLASDCPEKTGLLYIQASLEVAYDRECS